MLDRMRVLLTCSGAASHFNPLVPFVEAFERRGDDVLVVVPPALAALVETSGHTYRLAADPPSDEVAAIWRRVPALAPKEMSVLVDKEIFGRLNTAALLPTVEDVCTKWHPDLVLREPCEYAAAIAAERAGIRHAQVAISLAEIEASVLTMIAPVLEQYESGIVERITAAPYLTRFPASLDSSRFAMTQRFREDAVGRAQRRREPLPDWWRGDPAPLVYLTLGTVAGGLPIGAAAYRAALGAVAGLGARVLLTVGRTFDAALLEAIPANVHVEAWVPQDEVLAEAAVVVCHGGSGTTFGALAAGVPLVIVPMFADQPVNARLVSAAGAGLVVTRGPGSMDAIREGFSEDVPMLRTAIETVLSTPSYRHAAARIAAEMRALPTVDDVVATFGS
jgi:UDP:flavonoid glycosyltransferase YjiC (YdhE family)